MPKSRDESHQPVIEPQGAAPQRTSRRTFLKAGGGILLVAAAGGVWWSAERGVWSTGRGPAFAPWERWRGARPPGALGVALAGILAANPHNTQPWLFRVTDTAVELFADTARNLGAFDPFLREMHIGLGCAVENMVLAARAAGFAPNVTLAEGTLDGIPAAHTPRRVATLDLTPAEPKASDLHAAIARRHTNRGPYDAARPVPAALVDRLRATATEFAPVEVLAFTEPAERDLFSRECVRATELLVADPDVSRDSHAWFRHTWAEYQAHKDGVFIDTAGVGPLICAAVKMLPPAPPRVMDDGWIDGTRRTLASTPVVGLLTVPGPYDTHAALLAGRAWQRLHLAATTAGLAMQPVNQLVEVADRDRQLGREPSRVADTLDRLTAGRGRATFCFRLGYAADAVPPSARRPLADLLLSETAIA